MAPVQLSRVNTPSEREDLAMARRAPAKRRTSVAGEVLDMPDASLVDVLDHVLTKGVMASGDVTLGVAGIDLIYLNLSAVLGAADRVLPAQPGRRKRRLPGRRPPLWTRR
jgi:hypothetical protein